MRKTPYCLAITQGLELNGPLEAHYCVLAEEADTVQPSILQSIAGVDCGELQSTWELRRNMGAPTEMELLCISGGSR